MGTDIAGPGAWRGELMAAVEALASLLRGQLDQASRRADTAEATTARERERADAAETRANSLADRLTQWGGPARDSGGVGRIGSAARPRSPGQGGGTAAGRRRGRAAGEGVCGAAHQGGMAGGSSAWPFATTEEEQDVRSA